VDARWTIEQVEAIAPSPASVTAARGVASPSSWTATGADGHLLWGTIAGAAAEPYDVMIDHRLVAVACTCPSRRLPCKHALGLLLLWVSGAVPEAPAPPPVQRWAADLAAAAARADVPSAPTATADEPAHSGAPPADRGPDDARPHDRPSPGRDARYARMMAGLVELDRWIDDRMRIGIADPGLARPETWEALAARLVDAQAGSLANRVRRVASSVGTGPGWHSRILEELGLLHLLCEGGRRVWTLPDGLGDRTAVAVGWQVRTADVLAGVPESDEWFVAGRSDRREDRIEVRRTWLRGVRSRRWAMVLSFAAYRQSLDETFAVGTRWLADLHRYPGGGLRALIGRCEPAGEPTDPAGVHAVAVPATVGEIGDQLAAEPWLDRVPATVVATPARSPGGWVLTDDVASLPLHPIGTSAIATLLALSSGDPVDVTIEWTPDGAIPLAVHRDGRSYDVGPRADPSFVGAA
jgi:hypothetical protein